MGAAAAQYGAVAGVGEIAKALIDREMTERIEGLHPMGTIGDIETDRTARGFRRSGGSVARTERAIQNFYININNNIGGDYVINEGDQTDAEQIQALFDQGLVTA